MVEIKGKYISSAGRIPDMDIDSLTDLGHELRPPLCITSTDTLSLELLTDTGFSKGV